MSRVYPLLAGLIGVALAMVACTSPTASQNQAPPSVSPAQTQTPASPKHEPPPRTGVAAQIAQLPEDQRPKIVALGDSITAGPGVEDWEAYPKQLERLLNEQGYPHMVYNAGVSGVDTARIFPRLAEWTAKKPVLVIIELGLNDRNKPEETKANLTEIIKRFQAVGSKVVLSGQESEYSRKLYEDLAAELKIPLIPDMRHGLEQEQGYQSDGVHCNPKGCLYMAERNVLPVILPLLSK